MEVEALLILGKSSKDIAESLGLSNTKGAFISSINPNGPSKKAGIQEGDVILKFNNIEIAKMSDLPRVVAESDVGSKARVQIWRKNKLITIDVILGMLPEKTYGTSSNENSKKELLEEHYIEKLNLKISDLEEEGVKVIEINPDSNLQVGDIITEVNREVIKDSNSFIELVNSIYKTGRNSLLLRVFRDNTSIWITIKFIK